MVESCFKHFFKPRYIQLKGILILSWQMQEMPFAARSEEWFLFGKRSQAKKKKYMRKLERIFFEVDISGDGLISEEEFNNMMEEPLSKNAYCGGLRNVRSDTCCIWIVIQPGNWNSHFRCL